MPSSQRKVAALLQKPEKKGPVPFFEAFFEAELVLSACCGCTDVIPRSTSDDRNVAMPADGRLVEADISTLISTEDGIHDDPREDGWQSEVFSSQAQEQIERLLGSVKLPKAKPEDLAAWIDELGQFDDVQPTQLISIFDDGAVKVRRWSPDSDQPRGPSRTGAAGFWQSLRSWRELADTWPKLATKFKMIRVDLHPPLPTTTLLCSLTGHDSDRSFQMTARVTCSWRVGQDDHSLRLTSLVLESYEDVFSQVSTGTLFREYTPSLMAEVTAYPEQLSFSCDDWAQQVEARLGANFMGYQGVSVGDVNGDLLEDVYLCQTGGIPNLLLVQQPDGTLRDVSAAAGVDLLDSCRAALLIDIDNDADQDLVISSITGTLFFENDGQGQFTFRRRFQQGRLGYSLAAADYDLDGDLDVYVCLYHPPREAEIGNPLPYYDANNGSPNVLLANDGDWQFHDATSESGLHQHNQRLELRGQLGRLRR